LSEKVINRIEAKGRKEKSS